MRSDMACDRLLEACTKDRDLHSCVLYLMDCEAEPEEYTVVN